ncbi:quinone oxidoreductase, NADPH-dependent [Streptomyces acidiscabies]|nr:quinone oxidoreductase, NADPH-dependent [Streptomyces acidiscabies]
MVVEVGAAVTRFAVGDEVFARPDKNRIGTFAELLAVHQDDVAIKPGGGLGTIAIQLAKHLGVTVATTASTANVDLVGQLGADVVVDYREQAFETALHDYDVVLDSLTRSSASPVRLTPPSP